MTHIRKTSIIAAAAALGLTAGSAVANELNVYNWSDYIAEDTIANFEAETGIKVTYDMYDSNEVLEAKMLAGSSGYDVVVPTGDFWRGAARRAPIRISTWQSSATTASRTCRCRTSPTTRSVLAMPVLSICGAPPVWPIMWR